MLIPKHTHATPFPPLLPYQCPSQLSKSSIFQYLIPTPEGVWKTNPGERKQTTTTTTKSWLISQEQQCQTWLASSTSNYILPALMLPFSALKFFTPPFRSLRTAPCPCPCRTLPPVPGTHLSSLLCSGPWYCHTTHSQANSSARIN